jgi:hypothetical protein
MTHESEKYKNLCYTLGFLLVLFAYGYISNVRNVGDYRQALDEANTTIEDTRTAITNAKDDSDSSDFDGLHDIINGLPEISPADDPHPPSDYDPGDYSP